MLLEGSEKRISIYGAEFRQLMKQTPKGAAYMDSYNLKCGIGTGLICGSGVVLVGGILLRGRVRELF